MFVHYERCSLPLRAPNNNGFSLAMDGERRWTTMEDIWIKDKLRDENRILKARRL